MWAGHWRIPFLDKSRWFAERLAREVHLLSMTYLLSRAAAFAAQDEIGRQST